MATQITDDGIKLRIVTNGVLKILVKSSIKTVEVLFNSIIKIDIGKDSLRNIYLDRTEVDVPVSTSAADLRDKIAAMLQGTSTSGETSNGTNGATAANQLLQTAELQSIKTSVGEVNSRMIFSNSNMLLEPKLMDETEGKVIYKGYAVPGTGEDISVWAIQRISNREGIFSYHWAQGNKNFDKKWTNRREYQYT